MLNSNNRPVLNQFEEKRPQGDLSFAHSAMFYCTLLFRYARYPMWEQIKEILSNINSWRKHNPLGFWTVSAGLIILALILVETIRQENTGFNNRTLWDWLDKFVVSAMVAVGLFWLRQRENRRDKARQELDKARQIESQKEAALQGYLDKMSELLLKGYLEEEAEQQPGEKNSQVAESKGKYHHPKAATLARARTLTVLRILDPSRVSAVFRFLDEADLVESVSLADGDLRGVDWNGADLFEVNLRGANLTKANLREVYLRGADLIEADLREVDLGEADLRGADLIEANLVRANLIRAKLASLHFFQENLR